MVTRMGEGRKYEGDKVERANRENRREKLHKEKKSQQMENKYSPEHNI